MEPITSDVVGHIRLMQNNIPVHNLHTCYLMSQSITIGQTFNYYYEIVITRVCQLQKKIRFWVHHCLLLWLTP